MAISGILFDMDGLLVDTEPLWLIAEEATMRSLGATWTQADQLAILGGPLEHAAHYMVGRSGTELSAHEVGQRLIGRMLELLRTEPITLQPGAAELVGRVAASGIPYALVSASLRQIVDLVLAALARAGVPAFPVTIAGDEVARTKPDPQPYLQAAAALGIDIASAVVLEDSVNGVRAGWASGASVIAVPHVVTVPDLDRVVVIDTLEGLDLDRIESLVDHGTLARGGRADAGLAESS